jgi:hypothetical protein
MSYSRPIPLLYTFANSHDFLVRSHDSSSPSRIDAELVSTRRPSYYPFWSERVVHVLGALESTEETSQIAESTTSRNTYHNSPFSRCHSNVQYSLMWFDGKECPSNVQGYGKTRRGR